MLSPRITDPLLRRVFEDPGLSLAAKGALAFVLTRPPGARVSEADLLASSSDPLAEITKAVRELARTGLVGTVKGERAGAGVALKGGEHQRNKRWDGEPATKTTGSRARQMFEPGAIPATARPAAIREGRVPRAPGRSQAT